MNPLKFAREYVAKGETSREKIDRQDQVAAVGASAILAPILLISTVWFGGIEVLFAWIGVLTVAIGFGCWWRKFAREDALLV